MSKAIDILSLYLEDGQVINIFPDNYGTLILRKMMREAGCTKKVIIGGWSSSTYGSRVDNQGGVTTHKIRVYYRAITLRGAALPASDTEAFIESSKYLPSMDAVTFGDGVVAGDIVLDTGFSNVNPVLHCPSAILGASVMENFGRIFGEDKKKFSIYSHVYCPSVSEVQYSFYLLTLLATYSAKTNLIFQSAGIMDSYNSMCYDKFIVDLEIIGMVKRYVNGVKVDPETLAVDVIAEVGIAGQFLTSNHTMKHFRKEPFLPEISLRGAVAGDPAEKLIDNIRIKKEKMLASYCKPEMSTEIQNQLVKYLLTIGCDRELIESLNGNCGEEVI